MTITKPNQHPLVEGCFFCVTDAEKVRDVQCHEEGIPWDGRLIHIHMPASFCPNMTAEENGR